MENGKIWHFAQTHGKFIERVADGRGRWERECIDFCGEKGLELEQMPLIWIKLFVNKQLKCRRKCNVKRYKQCSFKKKRVPSWHETNSKKVSRLDAHPVQNVTSHEKFKKGRMTNILWWWGVWMCIFCAKSSLNYHTSTLIWLEIAFVHINTS